MTFDFLIFFVFIIVFFLQFIVLCALLGYLMLVRVVYAQSRRLYLRKPHESAETSTEITRAMANP